MDPKQNPAYSIIFDLAEAFAYQFLNLALVREEKDATYDNYLAAIKDDAIAVANVLHRKFPEFNMDLYYEAANYPSIAYPVH